MSRSFLIDARAAHRIHKGASRLSIRWLRDVEQTTPSAPVKGTGPFYLMARPPLLDQGGECARIKHSGNSFTPSDALGNDRNIKQRRRQTDFVQSPAMLVLNNITG